MTYEKKRIPYYSEINDLLSDLSLDNRTTNPLFYCLRLKPDDSEIYKPPFKRGFYFLALLHQAKKTEVSYDNEKVIGVNSLIVFQPPNLVYSFLRDKQTDAYIIYFKPSCFSFFKPEIEKEFPFFDSLSADYFQLDKYSYSQVQQHFEEVFTAYDLTIRDNHAIAVLKLLALLYVIKNMMTFHYQQDKAITPQQILLKKFVQLVSNNYIDKRTIDEYAQLLNVTPNHLSKSVKAETGQNALTFINERLLTESKSLISHTDFDMAEIAYRLNFSDPSNFANFFKKRTGVTPLEFRKKP